MFLASLTTPTEYQKAQTNAPRAEPEKNRKIDR